ncbi:Rossmann-fold NAD(P)-binding domain-containing protein [Mucilaginibacter ginsenosidivorax]|uniref:Uncharacterized protein n=1 Tax=Mucilaginibacter ginsenosidivorax TaxID=862126 RepID=A0A5B8W4T8_9SPHI|nr:hypothetical protein [Mucilaginibacter ginsenosidivorax]QEC78874.1 hypothetical protein FSB76_24060 [Mucilaginibacter ginsenosidivorax]
MKRYLIYFSAICLFLASCKKEENPKASPNMQDPFARIDNTNNPADHQIYLFYKESGIPVLYNDTVAKTPLTKLNLGYHLTTVDSMVTAKYLHNQADILAGLDFVKNQIAPHLSNSLKPYSILLTDSVYTFQPDPSGSGALVKVPLSAYLGFNTVAISYVPAIKTMDQTQLKIYRKDILKVILTAKIGADPSLTTKFYAVSSAYYGKTAYGSTQSPYYLIYQPKPVYGLLPDGTEGPNYYDVHGPAEDLAAYLDTVLVMSPADFVNTYQSYPLVIQKYNYLLDIFKTIGFTVPQ